MTHQSEAVGMRRTAEALAEQAQAAAYLAGWRAVRWMPEGQARAVFDRLADRVYRRNGSGVRQLRRNLDLVTGGAGEDLVRAGVRSYLRYWREAFRLPTWSAARLVARTRATGERHFRDPLAAGTGVVVVLPHMANWDWAGAWACATGAPVTTVAERLHPERLYDEFVAYRASLGMTILPLTGGASPLPRLAEHLRAGGLVCLLGDRDLGRQGIEVDLCGHGALMPAGPALLARMTGAPLVPLTMAYDGEDLHIALHDPVPVGRGRPGLEEATRQVADVFGCGIAAAPQDWHMMQRVFVEDRR
jgi:KDO2-lipid IV(A) lauroyltransferase